MAYSYNDFGSKSPGDTITVPFQFRTRDEVFITVGDSPVSSSLYSWVNDGLISCGAGFPSGAGRISRRTPVSEYDSEQSGSSVYDWRGVNGNFEQALFVLQEYVDGEQSRDDTVEEIAANYDTILAAKDTAVLKASESSTSASEADTAKTGAEAARDAALATVDGTVKFNASQSKTELEKKTARNNMGLGTNAVNALGIAYPEDFGAVGDGEANDTAALQAWANWLSTYGGIAATPGRKVYLHSAPIIWRPQVSDGSGPPYTPASGIIFQPRHKPIHFMLHASEFRATASMGYQWRFIYGDGVTVTAQAPFFVRFEGGFFNRNGFATESIRTEFAGWWKIFGTRFDGGFSGTCIKQIGYGAAEVRNCQARGFIFMDLSDATTYPGTDSSYTFNDLYCTGVGFLLGPGTGSLGIYENTMTVEDTGNVTANLVKIDSTAAADGPVPGVPIMNRDISIECNRQAGGGQMVYLRGKATKKNIRNITVRMNTYTHYGASSGGAIIDANEVSGIKVQDNMFSDRDMVNSSSLKTVVISNANFCEVHGNIISKVNESAVVLSAVTRSEVSGNIFQNVGSATYPNIITLISSSQYNDVHHNVAFQDTNAYATTLLAEDGTANFNRANDNRTSNMTVNHLPQGASSDMGNPFRHDTYQASGSVPANSTYYLGAGKADSSEENTFTTVSRPATVNEFFVRVVNAPGAGQTYTYMLRKNGVDTSMTGTITGASSFSVTVTSATGVSLNKGDTLDIKVTSTATTNSGNPTVHSSYILLSSQ